MIPNALFIQYESEHQREFEHEEPCGEFVRLSRTNSPQGSCVYNMCNPTQTLYLTGANIERKRLSNFIVKNEDATIKLEEFR